MSRALHIDARVRRGEFRLDVTMHLAPGETLGVIGPNGAGKTTLLRAVAGLSPLADGSIRCGESVWDDPGGGVFTGPAHRRAPVVFQDYRLFPHLSVLDNVAYSDRARGADRTSARARAEHLLDRMGLIHLAGHRPGHLSGGQAQRVAMARALSGDPAVLLLDEPLAALDVVTRQEARLALKQTLALFAGPTLLISHDPVEAMTLVDRLIVLEDGRVVQSGSPQEVAARPATAYVARFVDPPASRP